MGELNLNITLHHILEFIIIDNHVNLQYKSASYPIQQLTSQLAPKLNNLLYNSLCNSLKN